MNKNKLINGGIGILLIIAVVSGGILGLYGYALHRDHGQFQWLKQTLYQSEKQKDVSAKSHQQKSPKVDRDQAVLDGLKHLHQENGDMAGWVSIPHTHIDYPMMYTPQEPEYYLRRNFSKKYSISGTPFIDGAFTFAPRSDNLIVYGHNMKDGSMFADLFLYEDGNFRKSHPDIYLYTSQGKQIYEIMAVVETEVYSKNTFDCYSLIDTENKQAFDEYVYGLKAESLYDIDVSAEYGDELLTLSTCSHHTKNGRLVVVGRHRK